MSTNTLPEGRSPLTTERQDLAARYMPLARAMARPLKRAWPCARDDFESAACLALVEAAESFDPDRRVKFPSFAQHRIKGALQDVQRQMAPLGWRHDPENAPAIVPLTENSERYGRVLLTEPDPPVGRDLRLAEQLDRGLSRLPRRQAEACRRVDLKGQSQRAVARDFRLSPARFCRLRGQALARLRETWPDDVSDA